MGRMLGSREWRRGRRGDLDGGVNPMRSFWKAGVLGAVSGLALTAAAEAKTLVFCSEGSPEGFNPQLFTAGTTFDASSRQVYNRLIEPERGTTNLQPAAAESYTISDDGLTYTFKLRPGVKWQTTEAFTPTRDLTADDVMFSIERQLQAGASLPQGLRRLVRVLPGLRPARADQVGGEGRRPDRPVRPEPARRDVRAAAVAGLRLGDVGRVRRQDDAGRHAGAVRPRTRSAPARSSSSTTDATR